MLSRQPLIRYLPATGFALALLACYLPWIAHPAAALAPNAFDLAEWTSLHPQVRGESPTLLTTLLLRAVVAACGVGFALAVRWGWVPGLVVAGVLLPPFDFFRDAGGDLNFRQQFALAVATAVLAVLAALAMGRLTSRVPTRWQAWRPALLVSVPAALGGVMALWGLSRAMPLIDAMYDAGVGPGGPLALVGFALALVGAIGRARVVQVSPADGVDTTGVGSGVSDGVGVGSQAGGNVTSTG